MKLKVLTVFYFFIMFTAFLYSPLNPNTEKVEAQNALCELFPFLESIGGVTGDGEDQTGSILCGTAGDNAGEDIFSSIGQFIRFLLSLTFIGIIAYAIFFIIKSALKYIRSEGKEDEVQNAQKAIKSVFVGIGALFVGIIGLVIILVFFNSQDALNTEEGDSGIRPVDDILQGVEGQ